MGAGDNTGRQRRGQDELNEPICMSYLIIFAAQLPWTPAFQTAILTTHNTGQQEILRLLQSHHRRRLPDKRSPRRRPPRDNATLGHRGPRTLPIARRSLLPRRRLLRPRLRCQQQQIFRHAGQLAGRIPDPS